MPIAWHPDRLVHLRRREKVVEVVVLKLSDMLNLKMYYKEDIQIWPKEVTAKDFYGQSEITAIFTIDVNKVVVSDKVPCNIGKDWRYIVGYQVDGKQLYHCL